MLESILSSANPQKVSSQSNNQSPFSNTMPKYHLNENPCAYPIQCLRQISESIKQHIDTQNVRNKLQKDFDLMEKKMFDCVPKSIRVNNRNKPSGSSRGNSVGSKPHESQSNLKKEGSSSQSKIKKMKLPTYQNPYPTINQIQRSRRIRSVTPPKMGVSSSSSSSSIKKIRHPLYNKPNLPNAIQQQKN